MNYVILNNGVKMPNVGIGTFMIAPADAQNSVREALKMGYRLIDTANAYVNERAVGRGIKESGVSREDILNTCEIEPQVEQVECHPYFPQTKLRKVTEPKNIKIMCWYPLGHGDKSLMEESVVTKLADKYSKSSAQIILKWHTQMGFIVIPGSKNVDHIRDNFDLFDFELTSEEMDEISALDKNFRYYYPSMEQLKEFAKMQPE